MPVHDVFFPIIRHMYDQVRLEHVAGYFNAKDVLRIESLPKRLLGDVFKERQL